MTGETSQEAIIMATVGSKGFKPEDLLRDSEVPHRLSEAEGYVAAPSSGFKDPSRADPPSSWVQPPITVYRGQVNEEWRLESTLVHARQAPQKVRSFTACRRIAHHQAKQSTS